MRNSTARFFLQQSITLSGGGLPRFNDALLGVHIIESIFSREFQENELETYETTTHDGFPTVEASNRYFSNRRDIPNNDHLDIPPIIDPHGYLKELRYHDLVYTHHNVVEYYEAKDNR